MNANIKITKNKIEESKTKINIASRQIDRLKNERFQLQKTQLAKQASLTQKQGMKKVKEIQVNYKLSKKIKQGEKNRLKGIKQQYLNESNLRRREKEKLISRNNQQNRNN